MRNLKKILALVLALIMSLSLMATAGATDFKDDENVSDTYRVAVEVLSDLGVFNGDQNGQFNPEQPITRAEVAAIIYRIATGDVTNERNGSYAPYNQFPDIMEGDWYAGYVTYCANAGYVKGRNTGKFDPKDNVTGYEVLAMILRAVGYDKNNEFVGSNWQTNTASLATQKGVLKNITSATSLGAPATRETVAELLFRSILLPQVNWNAATLSYDANRETLAKENLGMESVTGVIMANEYANLNEGGAVVLKEGKTELKPEGEKALTLDISTELEAVGLSYSAYIQNGTKVLGELEYCDDLNTDVSNEGAKATVSALLQKAGLTLGRNENVSEYFLNYSEDLGTVYSSKHVIRYAVAQADAATYGWTEYITGLNTRDADGDLLVPGHSYEEREITINGTKTECYVVRITPNYDLTDEDYEIMKWIFYSADRLGETGSATQTGNDKLVLGEVYVGTNSTVDVSDWNTETNSALSWEDFVKTYLNPTNVQYVYTGCNNGESLRVIDNNGDNVADFILKVEYWQDEAIDTEKGELVYNALDVDDYYYSTFVDEIALGDVVNYTSIDGRVTVWKADMITGKVTEKNFQNVTILTTANDTVYGQSAIYNDTFMDDQIMATEDAVEYNFYLDEYGYIRSYELAQGTQYALLTEIYNTTGQAYNYVNSNVYTAEMQIEDGEPHEYRIVNANPFISAYAWTSRISNYYYTDGDLNYLQPAIAHLGVNGRNAMADTTLYTGATVGKNYNYVSEDWKRGVFQMDNVTAANNYWGLSGNRLLTSDNGDYGVFNYGTVANETWLNNVANATGTTAVKDAQVDRSFSFTNVAIYALGDDNTVSLRTASKLKTNTAGDQLYYWNDPTYVAKTSTTAQVNATYPWDLTNKTAPSDTGIGRLQKTAADWRAEYVKATGIKDDAANKKAIDNALHDCLVEVYDVDYVQLQTNAVTTNQRHFYIAGDNGNGQLTATSYGNLYNALSNGYVNATVDTEFYIAMPGKVLYYKGYDKLLNISADHIRAAYAVATNAHQDAEGYDYWIANVIVIEVEELDNPYDSISLMYYNPNEISGNVRNVRSLNNMWRTYQPDSDEKANIPVIPKKSDGGSDAWGNHSWTDNEYGFYEVYDSVYGNGELTAGDVQLLPALPTTDWAGHGIKAGTIQRVWGLNSSEYIDVDSKGRDYTGTPINDIYVSSVTVTDGTSQIPVYRVDKYNTQDLRLGKRVTTSDILPGDEVILVYADPGANTKLAYVVDLGTRYASNGQLIYAAKDWLWANYEAIIGRWDAENNIQFTSNFKQYWDDTTKEVVTFPKAGSIALGSGDSSTKIFDATTLTYTPASLPTGYILVGVKSADTNCYTVDVTGWPNVVVKSVNGYDLRNGVSLELVYKFDKDIPGAASPIQAKAQEDGFGVPTSDWKILSLEPTSNSSSLISRSGAPADPVAGEMVDMFFIVAKNYEVENVTISSPDTLKGTYGVTRVGSGLYDENGDAGSDYVKYYITFKLPAEVVELTINVANDNLTITPPANTTVASGAGTDVVKDEALGGKKITIEAKPGYDLPKTVTVKVGTTTIPADKITYTSGSGEIAFDASVTTLANAPIVIEGTATVEKKTLIFATLTDVSNVTVKDANGDVVDAERTTANTWKLESGKQYTITVTPAAPEEGKFLKSVIATNITGNPAFTKDATGGTYTSAKFSISTDISNATIAANYENIEKAIDITASSGATFVVKQGTKTIEASADDGKYTINTQTPVEIIVTAASGKDFLKAPTATGLEAAKNNDGTYTLTGTVTGDVTIEDTYWVKQVTVNSTNVDVEPNSGNTAATGKLTVTVATNVAFTADTGSDPATYSAQISVTGGTESGYTIAVSGSNFNAETGKLTVTVPAADVDTGNGNVLKTAKTIELDVTVTPTPAA